MNIRDFKFEIKILPAYFEILDADINQKCKKYLELSHIK